LENSDNNAHDPEKYAFILFVSGMSVKSGHAIENLRNICDQYLSEKFSLQIIDINSERQKAVDYQIIGIPTLIKAAPGQTRTIVGDLSDTEKVLKILDIKR